MNEKPETALTELIRYNNWANQQVLEACQELDEAELATQIPGAYGSIRDTLAHIFRAEANYVSLLTGSHPQPPFQWEQKPSLAEMKAYATQVGEALVETVNCVRLTDPSSEAWESQQLRYPALIVFIQIVNHGIEHRTNITTILNQEELAPPSVSGWGYLLAHRDRFELKGDN